LHVPLELRGIHLIAEMEGEDSEGSGAGGSIETTSIEVFKLPAMCEKEITLQAIPRKTGQMTIKGFSCGARFSCLECRSSRSVIDDGLPLCCLGCNPNSAPILQTSLVQRLILRVL
jgi:hypothetical protein